MTRNMFGRTPIEMAWHRLLVWPLLLIHRALQIAEMFDELAKQRDAYRAALLEIADIGGNLPDARLHSRTGPNDAVARGLMVIKARAIARKALGIE